MADKTYGFKVGEEFYEKAKLVIETSGMTNKEWFERAVALYEMNSIKEGSGDYKQDLTELEHHTTRMYELIVNMIQRSVYLKDHAVKEVADELKSKESVITNLQQQLQNAKEALHSNAITIDELAEKVTELEGKLTNNQIMLNNNQALIEEYKNKNDTLNGLVVKYQDFADKYEDLKKQFEQKEKDFMEESTQEKEVLVVQINNLKEQVRSLSDNMNNAQSQKDQAELKHKQEIELLVEQKKVEKGQALVEEQARHNDEVRKLYDEIESLRKAHQEMKERLQNEIMELREKKK